MPAGHYVQRFPGGVTVTLDIKYRGVGRMLASEMMHVGTSVYGAKIVAKATARAREGKRYPGSSGRDTGLPYPESFGMVDKIGKTRSSAAQEGYGTGDKRAYTEVYNDNPYAFYLEYGNRNLKNPPKTLRRAAGITDFTNDRF
jgi:hypothetical protein